MRNVDSPQHSPRNSSRKTIPDNTINTKPKLNGAITNNHDFGSHQSVNTSPKTEQGELLLQEKQGRHQTNHDSAKSKVSGTRGVLSNFRGLFTKQKDDTVKEWSTPTPAVRKPKATAKPKSMKHATAAIAGNSVLISGLQYRTRSVPSDEGNVSQFRPSRQDSIERIATSYSAPPMPNSPALPDTEGISSLTMEILESARREPNLSKKERLIRVCHLPYCKPYYSGTSYRLITQSRARVANVFG